MYLAKYGAKRQAAIRLNPPQPELARDWWAVYETLCGGFQSIPDWSAALRVVLTPGTGFQYVIVLATDVAHEDALRAMTAALLRLAAVSPDSIDVALSKPQYETMMAEFPEYRCQIDAFFETSGDHSFACDFRVAPELSALSTQAHLHGYRFGYQVSLRSFRATDEEWRDARKNVLRLGQVRGVPGDALALQARLATRLGAATALVDEYVAVDNSTGAAWLTRELDVRFQTRYARYRFGTLQSRCTPHGYQDQLSAPWFEPDTSGRDYNLAHAVGPDDIAGLLKIEPELDLAARYLMRPRRSIEPTRRRAYDVAAPRRKHAFVSYKREDLPLAASVIGRARNAGLSLWYDDEIPGGAQWMDELEAQLRAAFAVLFFVSPESVSSPYVKLELTYAFSMQIPIIPVVLKPAVPIGAVAFILASAQQLNVQHSDFDARLVEALSRAEGSRDVLWLPQKRA